MIAIASDHGGFELKKAIVAYFEENGIEYVDYGTDSDASVNYAPFAYKVGMDIVNKKAEKGILCCGTGIGISMAANKIKGIRAAVCANAFCAEMTRRHNDANIMCLGGRVITPEQAVEFTKIFMETPFEGGRHAERIAQIAAIENGEEI